VLCWLQEPSTQPFTATTTSRTTQVLASPPSPHTLAFWCQSHVLSTFRTETKRPALSRADWLAAKEVFDGHNAFAASVYVYEDRDDVPVVAESDLKKYQIICARNVLIHEGTTGVRLHAVSCFNL
jgi:hypothetical protein